MCYLNCTSNGSRYLLTNSFFLLGKRTTTALSAESRQHPKDLSSVSAIPIDLTNSTFHMFYELIKVYVDYSISKVFFDILIARQTSIVIYSHFYFFVIGKTTPTPLSPESSQHPKAVCSVSATPIDLTKRRPGRPSKRDISTRTSFFVNIYIFFSFTLYSYHFFIGTPLQHVAPIGSLSPKSTIHNHSIMYNQNNKSVTKGIYRSLYF